MGAESSHVMGPAGLTETQGYNEKQVPAGLWETNSATLQRKLRWPQGCQFAVVYLGSPTCQQLKNYQGRKTRRARDDEAPPFTHERCCRGHITVTVSLQSCLFCSSLRFNSSVAQLGRAKPVLCERRTGGHAESTYTTSLFYNCHKTILNTIS